MIVWHRVAETPKENQMCWLAGPDYIAIIGPLPYKEGFGWLDILATPKAGALYRPEDGITHWTEEENINLPAWEDQ